MNEMLVHEYSIPVIKSRHLLSTEYPKLNMAEVSFQIVLRVQ